jgi:hypothetical protein
MLALFFGRLVEEDGCIRARNEHDDYLVIWRHDYSVQSEGITISILDGTGREVVQVGDLVRFSGGEVAYPGDWQNLPGHCPGRYWVLGREVDRARDIVLETYEAIELGASRMDEVQVQGHLVAKEDEPARLCRILLESDPPQCGEPHLVVEGLDLATTPGLQTDRGVTWSAAPIELKGTLADGVLQVVDMPDTPTVLGAEFINCEQYTSLSVMAGGTAVQAVATCYECRGTHVDSTGRQPPTSPELFVASGKSLEFEIDAATEPTTIELRLYPGAGAYASFFRWPEELPDGPQPIDAISPEPSSSFEYVPDAPSGEYTVVVRVTRGSMADAFFAISVELE